MYTGTIYLQHVI